MKIRAIRIRKLKEIIMIWIMNIINILKMITEEEKGNWTWKLYVRRKINRINNYLSHFEIIFLRTQIEKRFAIVVIVKVFLIVFKIIVKNIIKKVIIIIKK